MTRLDWFAVGLALLIVGGFAGAMFLYLRTAYRNGGWRAVKNAALVAAFALIAFYVVRVAENSELGTFKKTLGWLTR